MFKSLLKTILIAFIIAIPPKASAYTAEDLTMINVDGNDLYFLLDDANSTATLLQNINRRGSNVTYKFESFTVPTTVSYNSKNFSVVLGEEALSSSPNLTTLVIPEGFTDVSRSFAADCPKLTTLSLPSSLKTIGDRAFSNCSAVTSVHLPQGLIKIGDYAFNSCSAITSIDLPQGLIEIGGGAFSGCSAITSIVLPESLKKLGTVYSPFEPYYTSGGAFAYTAITEIKIPSGVEKLGNYTFNYCKNLSKVILPEGLKVIGLYCFTGCTELNDINLPSSLEQIQRTAFSDCSKLTSINIPESVNFIGSNAFYGSGLIEIQLPQSLTVLRSAFLYGTPIKTLTVPSGVERVNPRGIESRSLEELTIADSDKVLEFDLTASERYGRDPWVNGCQETDAVGHWIRDNVTTLYLGRNIKVWIHPDFQFTEYYPDTEATTNPFYNLTKLENITVGTEVTDASQLAFENYPELKTVTFLSPVPPTLRSISREQAAKLTVTVPEGSVEAYKAIEGWADANYLTSSGIDGIITTEPEAEVEFFNLRGEKVANPSNGLFIKRQGSKVTKVIL